MTWGELIRRLRAAWFIEQRTGKGSHRQLIHPETGRVITVSIHTKQEGSGYRSGGEDSEGGRLVTQHYSVVVERESNGTFSAWVAGLPGVYAAGETASVAKRAIRSALAAHLDALATLGRSAVPKAEMLVLRADIRSDGRRQALRYVGLGALMGCRRTKAKAEASRINGRLGGRPRKAG